MYEFIGWVASLLLAMCAFPQFLKTASTGSAKDLSWSFLLMWGFGDMLMLVYVWPSGSSPLIFNYGLNAFLITGIVNVKLKELL